MNSISKRIGIIGGGQLGKMMILDAKRLGFYCVTLDPTPDCPSHSISDEHIQAAFDDRDAIRELAEKVDVMTYEFEHIDAPFLKQLEEEGYIVYPSPRALIVIQDKLQQKNKLKEAGIPIPDFAECNSKEAILDYLKENNNSGMLKTRLGGYDGKGNALIKKIDDTDQAFESLGSGSIPLMVEELINFDVEVSVLACRGIDGKKSIYPVGENIHQNSILDETIVPARISDEAYKKALDIADKVMDVFDGVGMFCIELFVTPEQEVLVNEVAPRPHNSGHYTIEGCVTSQFEQHIRAITGLPLGASDLVSATVMKNLLGEPGFEGKTKVEGLNQVYEDQRVKVHIYGKSSTKPYRKMGHMTVIDQDVESALKRIRKAYKKIKIQA